MSLFSCNPHSNYRAWLPDFTMTQSKKFHVGQQKTPFVLLLSTELKARSCVCVRHLFWMKTRCSCAYNKSAQNYEQQYKNSCITVFETNGKVGF